MELLVTFAIIAMLMGIVLSSMNSARNRGANGAIKSNLNNLRSQVELYYDGSLTGYTGLCTDTRITKFMVAADGVSTGTSVCYASASAWAVSSPLRVAEGSAVYWCVDSRSNGSGTASALSSGATQCP